MKRKCLENDVCPIARSLEVVGDWWSLLIVRDALLGKSRFSEFQKHLGVAKNILSARLRKLAACGVLQFVPASAENPHAEYVLTEKGRGLFLVLMALGQWGEESSPGPSEPDHVLVDRERGEPVRPLTFQARDGRPRAGGREVGSDDF